MHRMLVLGGVSFDSVIDLERLPPPVPATVFSRGFRETVGSTGAAKALNLKRLGFQTTLHALLGNDAPGQAVRAAFERENLHFVYDFDPKGTERHINLMDKEGQRISIYAAYATFEPQIDLARLEPLIMTADVIVLNIINYCRRLIPLAKRHAKPIWCDIHDYDGKNPYHQDFIEGADVLFMSDEAMPDYRSFMQTQIDAGKSLMVCTHGKRGSTALSRAGEWIETPALNYPLVDSNGAGDSFFAGVLYGQAHEYALAKSLRLGAILGGLTVSSAELFHPDLSPTLVEAEYLRWYGTAE